jgi:hypothetical protein
MTRNRAHLWVNVATVLVVSALASSGFLLAWRLPPGSGSNSMLGLSRHEWGDLHFYLSLGFLFLMVVHLLLNWKWVTVTLSGLFSGRNPDGTVRGHGGVFFLIFLWIVMALILAAPWLSGVDGQGRGGGRGKGAVPAGSSR